MWGGGRLGGVGGRMGAWLLVLLGAPMGEQKELVEG